MRFEVFGEIKVCLLYFRFVELEYCVLEFLLFFKLFGRLSEILDEVCFILMVIEWRVCFIF